MRSRERWIRRREISVGERGLSSLRTWEKRVVKVGREKIREGPDVEVVDSSFKTAFAAS